MLAAIGAKSIEELFSSIPERFRLRKALNIPGPYSEAEVIQYFQGPRRGKFERVHELPRSGRLQSFAFRW